MAYNRFFSIKAQSDTIECIRLRCQIRFQISWWKWRSDKICHVQYQTLICTYWRKKKCRHDEITKSEYAACFLDTNCQSGKRGGCVDWHVFHHFLFFIRFYSTTAYLCPKSSDYNKFFDYLPSKVKHILCTISSRRSPSSETSMFTTSFGFPFPWMTILMS